MGNNTDKCLFWSQAATPPLPVHIIKGRELLPYSRWQNDQKECIKRKLQAYKYYTIIF